MRKSFVQLVVAISIGLLVGLTAQAGFFDWLFPQQAEEDFTAGNATQGVLPQTKATTTPQGDTAITPRIHARPIYAPYSSGTLDVLHVASTSATSTFANGVVIQNGTIEFGYDLCAGAGSANKLYVDSNGILQCDTDLNTGGGGGGSDGNWVFDTATGQFIDLASSTNRVGIGTTSPYAKLSVDANSAGTTTLALQPASSATANIIDIYDTSAAPVLTSVLTANHELGISSTTPGAPLSVNGRIAASDTISGSAIHTGSSTATSTIAGGFTVASNNFHVMPDGRVGVNTANPQFQSITNPNGIHIAANNAILRLQTNLDGGWAITEYVDEDGNVQYVTGYRDNVTDFRFIAGSDLSQNTGFILNSSGDFGVGTGTPSATLAVQGDAHLSGSMTLASSTATSTVTASSFTANGGATSSFSNGIALTAGCFEDLNGNCITGGSGSPGGSDTQVQFNDSSSFGGDAGFTYNKTTDTATLANISLTDATSTSIHISGTASTTDLYAASSTLKHATTTTFNIIGLGTSTDITGSLRIDGTIDVGGAATSTYNNGIVLANGCFEMPDGTCLTSGSGLTSLNGETGSTQTFSSQNGTNVTLTITSATNDHEFALGWTGDLAVADGGTASSTPSRLLFGDGAGALNSTSSVSQNYLDPAIIVSTEIDTETELEALLTDVTDVFTDNDGALADDNLGNDDLDALQNVAALTESNGDILIYSTNWTTLSADASSSILTIGSDSIPYYTLYPELSDVRSATGIFGGSASTTLNANGTITVAGTASSTFAGDIEVQGLSAVDYATFNTIHATGTGTSTVVDNNAQIGGDLQVTGNVDIQGAGTSTFANGIVLTAGTIQFGNDLCEGDGDSDALYIDSNGILVCGTDATGAGGGIDTVKNAGVQVGDADIATLDFNNSFIVSESPDTEVNVSLNLGNYNGGGLFSTTTATEATTTVSGYVNRLYAGTTTIGHSASTTLTGDGRIGIGSTTPYGLLSIVGADPQLVLSTTDAGEYGHIYVDASGELTISPQADNSLFLDNGSSATARIGFFSGSSDLERLTVWPDSASGGLEVNVDSADFDFHVNGANVSDLIFVDAGNDKVGIATSVPAFDLSVQGDFLVSGNASVANLTASGTIDVQSSTATSTFANGIQLSGGCFEDQNGHCLSVGTTTAFDGTIASTTLNNPAHGGAATSYSTSTLIIPGQYTGFTVLEVYCKSFHLSATDQNLLLVIGDGTSSSTDTIYCDAAGKTVTITTGNIFTRREDFYVAFGSATTTVPDKTVLSITRTND